MTETKKLHSNLSQDKMLITFYLNVNEQIQPEGAATAVYKHNWEKVCEPFRIIQHVIQWFLKWNLIVLQVINGDGERFSPKRSWKIRCPQDELFKNGRNRCYS